MACYIIRPYQLIISPFLGKRCRFYPTCSQYSLELFQKFSFLQALWYSILRVSKCHPFGRGGFDPVSNLRIYKKN